MTKNSFAFVKGKPIVDVRLFGQIVLDQRLLVDSGADSVVISPEVCESLGWHYLGEKSVVVPGHIHQAPVYQGEIEFLNHRKTVMVLGQEIPQLESLDGLLGREFLDDYVVCFEEGERVTFEKR